MTKHEKIVSEDEMDFIVKKSDVANYVIGLLTVIRMEGKSVTVALEESLVPHIEEHWENHRKAAQFLIDNKELFKVVP